MINIVITDDHPLVIGGIKDMLSSTKDIHIQGTYLNGKSLLEGLREKQPDVLLLDIQMPEMSGDEIVSIIRKNYPDVKVLTLTNFDNTLYVNNMLANGASGYLLKNTDKDTLITAIKTVYNGQLYIHEGMKDKVDAFRNHAAKKTSSKYTLTPREKQILNLIVKGQSSHQIADILHLSFRTVQNYRFNLGIKLEVNNTAELIRKAIELGLDK